MNAAIRLGLAVLLGAASAASAGDFSLGFERYTGYAHGPDPLAGLSFSIETNEAEGYADFTLALDTEQGVGTVKSIWFERNEGLGRLLAITDTGNVDLRQNRGSRNPAGSRGELAWRGTDERLSRKGSASRGIDAGESLTMRFAVDESFFTTGLNALLSGDARIAFHLQRLGSRCDRSAHFVSMGGESTFTTAVPLPATGALAGAGLLAVGSRRRR
jgi:hypothetical protein